MKVNSKGRLTIPKNIRERAGLLPGTEVEISTDGEQLFIEKVPAGRKRGKQAQAAPGP